MKSTGGKPPALLDPFAGGSSIPLEAQRLGLEAQASGITINTIWGRWQRSLQIRLAT